MSSRRCPNCGAARAPLDSYCASCGHIHIARSDVEPEDSTRPAREPSGVVRWLIVALAVAVVVLLLSLM